MSRQLLVVVKCNNNKDIVRGIYNPKNSELKESKFNIAQLENLQEEVNKVLSRIKSYKTIKFYWNISTSQGCIEENKYIMNDRCYSNNDMIFKVVPNYFNKVNEY